MGIVADSTDPAAPKAVFEAAIERYGQVDILVNNAGSGDMVSVEEASDERFANIVDLNSPACSGTAVRRCSTTCPAAPV